MQITLIAAFDNERGMAKDGEIPWDIPEEQEHFYNETFGHPVIMGRNTFENIVSKLGGPLTGRLNIVLSKSGTYNLPQTVSARNIQATLEAAQDSFEDEVFVAGGESVYEQFIDHADRMVLTKVDGRYDCDQFFPQFSLDDWELQAQSVRNNFTILEYERR